MCHRDRGYNVMKTRSALACHFTFTATTVNAIIAPLRTTPTALIPRLTLRQYSWLKNIRSCLNVQLRVASTSTRYPSRFPSPLTIGAFHIGRGPGSGKSAPIIQQKGKRKPRQNSMSWRFSKCSTGDRGYFERSRCG